MTCRLAASIMSAASNYGLGRELSICLLAIDTQLSWSAMRGARAERSPMSLGADSSQCPVRALLCCATYAHCSLLVSARSLNSHRDAHHTVCKTLSYARTIATRESVPLYDRSHAAGCTRRRCARVTVHYCTRTCTTVHDERPLVRIAMCACTH